MEEHRHVLHAQPGSIMPNKSWVRGESCTTNRAWCVTIARPDSTLAVWWKTVGTRTARIATSCCLVQKVSHHSRNRHVDCRTEKERLTNSGFHFQLSTRPMCFKPTLLQRLQHFQVRPDVKRIRLHHHQQQPLRDHH